MMKFLNSSILYHDHFGLFATAKTNTFITQESESGKSHSTEDIFFKEKKWELLFDANEIVTLSKSKRSRFAGPD